MKKFFVVMMSVAMVFAFVLPVMADEVCEPCFKCEPNDIGCPGSEQEGTEIGEFCVCGDDYDVFGLYPDSNHFPNTDPCPVIFSVCECDDPAQFHAGVEVGVRMRILVNGQAGDHGAYFSQTFTGNVVMSNSREFLCEPACANTVVHAGTTTTTAYFCDSINPGDSNMPDAGEVIWRADQFTGLSYYTYNGSSYDAGATVSATCPPPLATNRVVQIIANGGLVLNAFDDLYNLSHWAIDIPRICVTPDVTECSTISVEICLMTEQGGGICGDCTCVCSCVYDLYTVCCEGQADCIFFPYVVFTDTGWDTAIVVNNMVPGMPSGSAMQVLWTFTAPDGTQSTWTDTGFASNGGQKAYIFSSDIYPNLVPAPTSTVGSLKGTSNFAIHGLQYMTNGSFGAEHDAACCSGPCGSGG